MTFALYEICHYEIYKVPLCFTVSDCIIIRHSYFATGKVSKLHREYVL